MLEKNNQEQDKLIQNSIRQLKQLNRDISHTKLQYKSATVRKENSRKIRLSTERMKIKCQENSVKLKKQNKEIREKEIEIRDLRTKLKSADMEIAQNYSV